MPTSPPLEPRSFRHEAFFYAGDDEFAEGIGGFLREGAAAGESTLVVVDAQKIGALREALNGGGEHVHFADMERVGANPGRIIDAWHDFVDEHGGAGRPLRGVGEPINAQRAGAELVECHHHEALLNVAFAQTPDFRMLCPYDTDALTPAVVEEARHTHPLVTEDGVGVPSLTYGGLDWAREPFRDPLPEPRVRPAELRFDLLGLRDARALVAAHAAALDLPVERTEDLLLAVSEVATNSVKYGGGTGVLRAWCEDDTLICEVRDEGHIADPLIGRRRPVVGVHGGGFGMWIAIQCCDLVQLRSFPDGTVVRLHQRLRRQA